MKVYVRKHGCRCCRMRDTDEKVVGEKSKLLKSRVSPPSHPSEPFSGCFQICVLFFYTCARCGLSPPSGAKMVSFLPSITHTVLPDLPIFSSLVFPTFIDAENVGKQLMIISANAVVRLVSIPMGTGDASSLRPLFCVPITKLIFPGILTRPLQGAEMFPTGRRRFD